MQKIMILSAIDYLMRNNNFSIDLNSSNIDGLNISWANDGWNYISGYCLDPLSAFIAARDVYPYRKCDIDDNVALSTISYHFKKSPNWIRSFNDGVRGYLLI